MIVSDNTVAAESLGSFFMSLGNSFVKMGKKLGKKALKNPGRALDVIASIASAAASRNPKAASSSLPDVMNLCHTGKRLYLGKIG